MQCPKCVEGKFRSKSGGYRKRTGRYTRIRICDKCGYKTKTVEISTDTYESESELMDSIIKAVNEYVEKLQIVKKP